VGVAVRALSPGVNDPFTAIDSVDRLSASLARLADRPAIPMQHFDGDGHLRVQACPQSFPDLLEAAFNPTRQAAAGNPIVMIRMLSSLSEIARRAVDSEARDAVRRQARLINEAARRVLPRGWDRGAVTETYREVLQALERPTAAPVSPSLTANRSADARANPR
jgi:uncharacterized membrane protein